MNCGCWGSVAGGCASAVLAAVFGWAALSAADRSRAAFVCAVGGVRANSATAIVIAIATIEIVRPTTKVRAPHQVGPRVMRTSMTPPLARCSAPGAETRFALRLSRHQCGRRMTPLVPRSAGSRRKPLASWAFSATRRLIGPTAAIKDGAVAIAPGVNLLFTICRSYLF